MVQLTKQSSLIVPVHLDALPPELSLGALRFHAKKEHHLTVFGFSIGKLLRAAEKAEPGHAQRVDAVAGSFDWAVVLEHRFYHLVRTKPDGSVLQTIIVTASARVDAFFDEVRKAMGAPPFASEAVQDFFVALTNPPPPHVTLYTSDAEGLAGIGLNTRAELEDAVGCAVEGEARELAAYPLAQGVVPAAQLKA
jgi:hypothetical protein